jgi:predicted membrane channel-forming protein YqfA (hemolysin III family)
MLQITSLLVASSATHALTRRHFFYAILLFFLCATSLTWHSCKHDTSISKDQTNKIFWLDQIAVWSVATITMFYALHAKPKYKLMLFVLSVIMVGLGAFLSKTWWDKKESSECHALIHIMSALMVHCVLLSNV